MQNGSWEFNYNGADIHEQVKAMGMRERGRGGERKEKKRERKRGLTEKRGECRRSKGVGSRATQV